jgi:glycosyltransferase involved in cell wall biosynthesis
MNILHTECGHNWGGQELRTFLEVRWLNAHGHRAWLVCDPRSESFRRGTEEKVPLIPITMRRTTDFAAAWELARVCRELKIDLIHNHGPKDAWISYPLYLAGIPVVRARQIPVPQNPSWARRYIYRHGCWKLAPSSEDIRRGLIRNFKISPERAVLLDEGVDLERFNPKQDGSAFRKEFGIAPEAPLFGIVAMLRAEKGHHLFLAAAYEVLKTYPQARFVIVGEGVGKGKRVERETREKLFQAFGPDESTHPVRMTGYRKDMPQIMAALDVLTVPSTSEAQTLVIPQAMATCRAVIGSRTGGIPELIEHEKNGLLFDCGDWRTMAAQMKQLIQDPALRRRLAEAGFDYARKNLSFEAKMEKTLRVYQEAVADPRLKQGLGRAIWRRIFLR